MQVYLVGGAVRDQLLGLPVTERDWVVVGATPQQLVAEGFRPVGADFPVFLHPTTHEEYALARTERKTGQGYRGFTFYAAPTVSLEEDLQRRDLTINAIAQAPDGQLIDPYGGQRDIQSRTLRHVSDAFGEDPVRILRAARFFARFKSQGFHIAPETLAFMRAQVAAGEVAHLVKERIWQEMQRAFSEPNPEAFFEVLTEVGALPILCPMLPQPSRWPALIALRSADPAPLHRWVAWVYSVTRASEDPRSCAQALCAHIGVPREYRELAVLFTTYYATLLALPTQGASMWVQWLEQVDAFRRAPRYEAVLEIATHIAPIGEWLSQLKKVQGVCASTITLPSNIDSTAVRAYVREIRVGRAKEILGVGP